MSIRIIFIYNIFILFVGCKETILLKDSSKNTEEVTVFDKTKPLPLRPQVPSVEARGNFKKILKKVSHLEDIPKNYELTNKEYYRSTGSVRGVTKSIAVVYGDIVKESDAIVIAVTSQLTHGDFLAKKVFQKAKINGKNFLELEATAYKNFHILSSLPPGTAIAMNPYSLHPPITMVIAAVQPKGPVDINKPYPKKLELFSAIYNSLLKGEQYGAKTVSISVMFASDNGLDIDCAVEILFKAVLLFFANETSSINYIRLVSEERSIIQQLAHKFLALFP
jgi:O-acetyl-ADP-ribose deacetylase (regulator of RNase III)